MWWKVCVTYIAHLFSSLAHFSINLGTMVADLLFFPKAHKSLSTRGFLKPLMINLRIREDINRNNSDQIDYLDKPQYFLVDLTATIIMTL